MYLLNCWQRVLKLEVVIPSLHLQGKIVFQPWQALHLYLASPSLLCLSMTCLHLLCLLIPPLVQLQTQASSILLEGVRHVKVGLLFIHVGPQWHILQAPLYCPSAMAIGLRWRYHLNRVSKCLTIQGVVPMVYLHRFCRSLNVNGGYLLFWIVA